jgi:Protein of unknown function (DUF4230)
MKDEGPDGGPEAGPKRRTVILIFGVVGLAFILFGFFTWMFWREAKRNILEAATKPQERVIDISTLVTQVRELNRLETASMRVMHVGTVSQTYKLVPNALGGDEITFLATGDVIAGVDLAKLTPNDVWREAHGAVAIRLPPAEILVSRVDNKESRVLNRKTGVLRRADIDLETRARQHAEENIRAEALKKGILPMASTNAEKKMAEFLRTVGFEKVRFVTSPRVAPDR